MKINLLNLVNFYDVDPHVRLHSNAIKTLAGEELCLSLLCQYFKSLPSTTSAGLLPERATGDGAWLDAWLKVRLQNQSEIYYQVEVKNWSFHGYGGGKPLGVSEAIEKTKEFKKNVWRGYWKEEEQVFKDPKLNKVLAKMNQFEGKDVVPLACLWAPMHPEGADSPFFDMKCQSAKFKSVSVFSVSAYLRNLIRSGLRELDIDLPRTQARIQLAKDIFGNS